MLERYLRQATTWQELHNKFRNRYTTEVEHLRALNSPELTLSLGYARWLAGRIALRPSR
jgi:hypothetical protein